MEHSERVTVLCTVLHWHRHTFVQLGCASLRRFVPGRVFGWWKRTAARVQDPQVLRIMERDMGVPPHTFAFWDPADDFPTFAA